MRVLISFLMLLFIKVFATIFYTLDHKWIGGKKTDFKKIRLMILLNHTSLYEPLYVRVLPFTFLWRLARKMVAPGADKTLDRPIVGIFWKYISPGMMSITRKRDKSWREFLKAIENRSIIIIAPEGRMLRKNGLDAYGKPMSIKSGIADILYELNEGRMLIAYSGGLHHIQHPGQKIPKLFKKLALNTEVLEIPEYKSQFSGEFLDFKNQLLSDLSGRLEKNKPVLSSF